MFSYSIAIRTLATNPSVLKRELESVVKQTVEAEKVVVYIANGYERPAFTVGKEEYVWVKKGMVAQRALRYDEIDSEVILMLDDDVLLADDSAEKMLAAMERHGADCVAADTFKNQDMTRKQHFLAWITNWVYARCDDGWAFRLCRNGSFTFNGSPRSDYYPTETFAGPCWMIKKKVLNEIRIDHELWLDEMGFPYGEDSVESYKLFLNGYCSGVLYDSGVENLDGKSSSGAYHAGKEFFYKRSWGMFATWWRMIYLSRNRKWLSVSAYSFKVLWQMGVHLLLGLAKVDWCIPYFYVKGQIQGWRFVHSEQFVSLPPYKMKNN